MRFEVMKRELVQFRTGMTELFTQLHELAVETGEPELKDVAARLVAGVNAPFLFVVVGEVKSGKSSFINALLGDQVTRVAPDPCTDTIQKIVYAEEPYTREVGENIREIGQPSPILRDIAVVDTPGTNSIIEKHQEITERFIPESDLVIFVFPALNPYSKTSWDLFQFVHQEWHKKIIFVLQQTDRASPEELEVNTARVTEYARSRHVEHPMVFQVSARMAWENPERSGLTAVWEYIRSTVTGGLHFLYKMESLVSTAAHVLDRLDEAITTEAMALSEDKAELERIENHLRRGRESSLRDVEVLKGRLIASYAKLAGDVTAEFEAGLGLVGLFKNSLQGLLTRKNVFKAWLEELHGTFNERFSTSVDSISREAAGHIADNIVFIVESLLDELRGSRSCPVRKGLDLSESTRRRLKVVDEVISNVLALLSDDTLSDRLRPKGLQKIGDQAMMGGFITAVGAIIAATAHAVVFDVTGGVFTTLGALLAINTLAFKRRSVIARFREGFEQGRMRFEEELGEKLTSQVGLIYADLESAFRPFFANIAEREERVNGLQDQSLVIRRALAVKLKRVEEMRRE